MQPGNSASRGIDPYAAVRQTAAVIPGNTFQQGLGIVHITVFGKNRLSADVCQGNNAGPVIKRFFFVGIMQNLAERYANLFEVFMIHQNAIFRVTFWGVTDGDSWKNNWPVRGRTNYPLLFNRQGQPKPAYDSAIEAANQL